MNAASPLHTLRSESAIDLGVGFTALVRQVEHSLREIPANDALRCAVIAQALRPLLRSTDWIPAALLEPPLLGYRRELLHQAADGSFSIGAFTWIPRHTSRIHDHHAWSVIGNITGVLRSENFLVVTPGHVAKSAADDLIAPGDVVWSTRGGGDIHRISVASLERSVSIHVYGCAFDAVNRGYYTE